ncbi:MAG: hypothetical protein WAN44_01260 [Propionibacteriaceae bacterium]
MHVASNGWSARLYWLWILYNSVAFVVVLTAVAVLSWISADVLHLSLSNRSWVVALLVATAGALLFGPVGAGYTVDKVVTARLAIVVQYDQRHAWPVVADQLEPAGDSVIPLIRGLTTDSWWHDLAERVQDHQRLRVRHRFQPRLDGRHNQVRVHKLG